MTNYTTASGIGGGWYVTNVGTYFQQPTATFIQAQGKQAHQQAMYSQTMWEPPPPPKAEMGELYFIYGTLKQGHRNHHLLVPEQMKLMGGAIANNFMLIELCNGVPAAVWNLNRQILGELWDMGKDNIAIMLAIEQGYEKQTTTLQTNLGNCNASIWAWPHPYNKEQALPYNDWDRGVEQVSYDTGLTK